MRCDPMRMSRFTEEQIIRIVNELDGGATWAEVMRVLGSEACRSERH